MFEISRLTSWRLMLGCHHVSVLAHHLGLPWSVFLQAHWEVLSAADCFAIDVLTLGGLQRYWALVVMELCTRRVTIAGIIAEPTG
jgi:hypothetical protein